jgi:hypothetical protein
MRTAIIFVEVFGSTFCIGIGHHDRVAVVEVDIPLHWGRKDAASVHIINGGCDGHRGWADGTTSPPDVCAIRQTGVLARSRLEVTATESCTTPQGQQALTGGGKISELPASTRLQAVKPPAKPAHDHHEDLWIAVCQVGPYDHRRRSIIAIIDITVAFRSWVLPFGTNSLDWHRHLRVAFLFETVPELKTFPRNSTTNRIESTT